MLRSWFFVTATAAAACAPAAPVSAPGTPEHVSATPVGSPPRDARSVQTSANGAVAAAALGTAPAEAVARSHSQNATPGADTQGAPVATAAARSLTVVSYNLNFGLAVNEETISALAELADMDAEVVFLQETNERWERAIRRRLGARYPHIEFRHDRSAAGGLAILSRYPFETAEYWRPPSGMFPAWRLFLDSPLGRLQVLHLHLIPIRATSEGWVQSYFRTQEVRLKETEAVLGRLERDMPTVIIGDLNEDATGKSLRLLHESGFTSVLTGANALAPTWRWETKEYGTVRWQLDHVLHSAELYSTGAEVREAGSSDHMPVIATLRRVSSPDQAQEGTK